MDFYCQEDRHSFRRSDTGSLKKRYAITNALKDSFFLKIVDLWDTLPFETRSASSVDIFKSIVIKNVNRIFIIFKFIFS